MSEFQHAKNKRDTRVLLKKFGWNLEGFHDSVLNTLVVYFFDPITTGFATLVTSSQENIDDMKKEISKSPVTFQDVCDSITTAYHELAKKQWSVEEIDMFSIGLLMYAIQTQSFQIACSQELNPLHFVVLYYHDSRRNTGMLRPFTIPKACPLLTPDDIYRASIEVMQYDRYLHPERFPKAEVIPLRPVT